MKASSICGSDIRAIYREHLGSGPEAYRGVIAGHEPCGQVVAVGPGSRRLSVGDRVVVYHIAGCGVCEECRHGYMIGCTSPFRAAHGWQRDGGHAEFLLADEATCILLPDELSYVDGALVSCGFGTAYEGLLRLRLSYADADLGCAALATERRVLADRSATSMTRMVHALDVKSPSTRAARLSLNAALLVAHCHVDKRVLRLATFALHRDDEI